MGREVRRVPADWQHPKRADGRYIPLYGRSYSNDVAKWDEESLKWENKTYSYVEYAGERPKEKDYMPDWPKEQRTHWQMYEDTSEGTPISPVMETPEALAHWLADNGASAFGDMTATFEQWLATIRRGYAFGMAIGPSGIKSGVEFS